MTDDILTRLRRPAPDFGLEQYDPTYDDRQEAAAEIERLRERGDDWRAAMTENHDLWNENERLRAALREIIQKDAFTGETVFVGDYGKIARAALGEKADG